MLQVGYVHGAGDEKETLSTAYLEERCDREGHCRSLLGLLWQNAI